MKDLQTLKEQSLVEEIIFSGKTNVLLVIFDRWFDPQYNYLLNYTKDSTIASLLSFYAMRLMLLSLPHYNSKRSFSNFVYTYAEKTCFIWEQYKQKQQFDQKLVNDFAQGKYNQQQLKIVLQKDLSKELWIIVKECLIQVPNSIPEDQLPDVNLLSEWLKIDRKESRLLLMNVWGIISIRYPKDHQDNFTFLLERMVEKYSPN